MKIEDGWKKGWGVKSVGKSFAKYYAVRDTYALTWSQVMSSGYLITNNIKTKSLRIQINSNVREQFQQTSAHVEKKNFWQMLYITQ